MFGVHLFSGTIVLRIIDVLIGVIPNLNMTSFGNTKYNPASVDIYVLPDCPWSKRLLKLLEPFHVKYNSHVITNDEEFKEISDKSSISTFPQIFINNHFIGGYAELSNLSFKGNLIKLIY